MTPFLIGLLAHMLYDVHWQGNQGALKGQHWFWMYQHALTWSLLIFAVLIFFDIASWWKFLFLFSGHYLIDTWKTKVPKTPEYMWAVYVDQGLHYLQILIVTLPWAQAALP